MSKKPSAKAMEEQLKFMDIEDALKCLAAWENEYGVSLEKLITKYGKKKAAQEKEQARFEEMCRYEKHFHAKGYRLIAGIDEAGRGPLAGPVVAAAVIFPEAVFIPHLNDSKKLSPTQRGMLFDEIKEKAIAYGIGIVDHKEIDEINILNATKKAMCEAVRQLELQPDFLLLDAVRLNIPIPQQDYVKGDANSISIAAASILAKVTRDRLLDELDGLYPEYGFLKHKGYGTPEHIQAIRSFGPSPIHRRSFIKNFTV